MVVERAAGCIPRVTVAVTADRLVSRAGSLPDDLTPLQPEVCLGG